METERPERRPQGAHASRGGSRACPWSRWGRPPGMSTRPDGAALIQKQARTFKAVKLTEPWEPSRTTWFVKQA